MTAIAARSSAGAAGEQGAELVSRESPLAALVSVNKARMHGEPCFTGTRVPVQTLFDHLRLGESLADFLDGFPDVQRQQAETAIDFAARGLLDDLRSL